MRNVNTKQYTVFEYLSGFGKAEVRGQKIKIMDKLAQMLIRASPLVANVLQLGVRFLAYRNVQVTDKLNSQKLTLRCCYTLGGLGTKILINNK